MDPEYRQNPVLARCTDEARRLGENPIGTAPTWKRCLVIEIKAPWNPKVETSRRFPEKLREFITNLDPNHDPTRIQCVLPNPDYPTGDDTRLILFSRPSGKFVTNRRSEYVVPKTMIADAAIALLNGGAPLEDLAPFREPDVVVRDLMVCTHGNRDTCCGSFGVPAYEALREMAKGDPMGDGTLVRVWRTSHTGGHRFAPTLIDFPDGRYWAFADHQLLKNLLTHGEELNSIIDHYRGWAAVDTCAEQNAEKAVLSRVGWDWLKAKKRIETLSRDADDCRYRVQFDYTNSCSGESGGFEITAEYSGSIPTKNCMKAGSKGNNPQYKILS